MHFTLVQKSHNIKVRSEKNSLYRGANLFYFNSLNILSILSMSIVKKTVVSDQD